MDLLGLCLAFRAHGRALTPSEPVAAVAHTIVRAKAEQILHDRSLRLSVQVLQEFYVQATRQSRPDPLTHDQAIGLVESFLRFPVHDNTTAVMLAAMGTGVRLGISYWDAAVTEAARGVWVCQVAIGRPERRS